MFFHRTSAPSGAGARVPAADVRARALRGRLPPRTRGRARAKWPVLTAAHAAAESLHVATAHAAPIAPEALALSPAALRAREKTRRRPVAAPLCLPKVVASLATQARW